jgi:hypothetical protein
MDHPRPSLKYVDANDLSDSGLKLNGLEVDGVDGEKLGKVEGFIIDSTAGRPYHIVVGAGHWFTHKHLLLPVGHAMLNGDGTRLIADLTQERVKRFPGFDKSKFEKLTDEDFTRMDEAMADTCCPDEAVEVSAWEVGAHYRYPAWWQESYYPSPVAGRRD